MAAIGILDHPLVHRIRDELKTNARARWLLAVVGVIVILSLGLNLSDQINRRKVKFNQGRDLVARLEGIAGESQWIERRNAANSLRAQLEGRLWSAENESLEKASYQDWISAAAREAGVTPVEVRAEIDPGTSNGANLKKLSASVSGPFDAVAFTRFLSGIARHNRMMVIERLQIHS